jgi:hypothetical protein
MLVAETYLLPGLCLHVKKKLEARQMVEYECNTASQANQHIHLINMGKMRAILFAQIRDTSPNK